MSTTVNETCACGARFEFRGDYGMTAAGAFRKAHAECRRAAEASCGGCGCADRLRADDVVEGAARQHAGLNPGDPWPSNEELGGNLTGTRDDEYRDAMLDEAKGMLSFAIAVLTDNHWHGGPDPCVPCSLDAAPDARGSDLSAEQAGGEGS